jgi:hypothetical protein
MLIGGDQHQDEDDVNKITSSSEGFAHVSSADYPSRQDKGVRKQVHYSCEMDASRVIRGGTGSEV